MTLPEEGVGPDDLQWSLCNSVRCTEVLKRICLSALMFVCFTVISSAALLDNCMVVVQFLRGLHGSAPQTIISVSDCQLLAALNCKTVPEVMT